MPLQNFAGAADDRVWEAGQARYFDPVTLVCASRLDAAQEHDFASCFLDGYVHVFHSRQQLLELRQLVIMRGEKRFWPRPRVQSFHNGPRNREPVKCGSSASHFVKQHETRGCCGVQDCRHFTHFHKKRRTAARQIVRRSDSCKDAIHHRQFRFCSRHERAHLRQDRNQRRLPQIRRFAAHIRPGDDQKKLRFVVEVQVIGHETLATFLEQLLNHRMSPARDQKRTQSRTRLDTCFTLRRATCKLRSRVVSRCRNPREVHQHVKLCDGRRRPPQARRLARDRLANFAIQPPLDFEYPLLGRQHLAFVLLQLARRESLGIDQSLLPLIISRRKMQIRFRNLDVETKHLVIANLERRYPGTLPLTLFHRRDNLASLLGDVAQLIELGVIAAADHSGIIDHRRRLFRNSARNQIAHVRHLVHLIAQRRKPGRPSPHRRDLRAHARNPFEGSTQRQQIARRHHAQRHAARQPLEIENPLKLPSYFLARHRLPLQLRHRFKPRFDLFDRYLRPQNPASQQTRTHPRRRLVNCRQQRCPRVIATRSLYKLQVPRGHLIKDHRVLLL